MMRKPLAFAVVVAVCLAGLLGLLPRSADIPSDDALAAPLEVVWLQQTPRGHQNKKKQAPSTKNKQSKKKSRSAQAPPVGGAYDPLPEGVSFLSNGDSYDDFASVVQTSDGTIYAAYAAYFDAHDQIRLHKRLPNGQWSTRTHVPLAAARADIWMPQLAVDAEDRVWVIWSEQTEPTRTQSGNWDLYARVLDGSSWGPLIRLTNDPKPDINLHVTSDTDGNIHVVWQSHAENSGDVSYCRYDGQSWSKPMAVSSGPESDWYPQVAVDSQGTAWIAFDSYRQGDYDVFLVSVSGDQVGKVIPIASSKYYEAHASVACTPDGRVWVAWEQGGWNWGKDQGHWLNRRKQNVGNTLGNTRAVKVAAYDQGRLLAGPNLASALGAEGPRGTAGAGLASDPQGRLWLRFRRGQRGPLLRGNRFRRYLTENVTFLSDDGWQPAQSLAGSNGRISVFSRQVAAADGGLLVAYSGDQRGPANYHQPIHDMALVAVLPKPEPPVGSPQLDPYEPPQPPDGARRWDDAAEARDVAAIRKHRISLGDASRQIVRGDLHRHTELSWDVGPGNDGSYLDFYRYMIDVAQMDFGALTDHQGGGHYAYHWWLTEKSADMYYLAPRFVPLYGYERSARFPNGHRNVFHSYRGVPVFPFQTTLDITGVFPGVGSGDLVDNDTKLLYEYLHRTGGVAISHTSGTSSMGTDWRDNDPEIEPVVEIYQGARNSYEVIGGARVHDIANEAANRAPGGFQEAGMVWNALAKGYRLGTTASSDHGSTHISYSMVYTPANDRESILQAIRQRHAYGGTDNLIVEFWANGHFMGDELTTRQRPTLELKVLGTGQIARVDLIHNNRYVYTTTPNDRMVDLDYVDMDVEPGLNYYYFRIQQDNGEVAWASPIWINYEAE